MADDQQRHLIIIDKMNLAKSRCDECITTLNLVSDAEANNALSSIAIQAMNDMEACASSMATDLNGYNDTLQNQL